MDGYHVRRLYVVKDSPAVRDAPISFREGRQLPLFGKEEGREHSSKVMGKGKVGLLRNYELDTMVESAEPRTEPAADAAVPGFDLSRFKLISQGAEARVWEGSYLDVPAVIKQRFSKKYRHAVLDRKITQSRLKQEVRSIVRARKLGVPTPVLYYVAHETNSIYMEKLEGMSVKAALHSRFLNEPDLHALLREIGRLVALLHDGGLIHGDLTTSNMLLRSPDNKLVLIDFGLSYNNTLAEDKAVDLYVLERAFTSAHSALGNLFDDVLASYRQHSRMWCPTLNKFAEVRMRGRKRTMVG